VRTALVAGGSRGIGLGFVERLLERGDRVIAVSRTAEETPDLASLRETWGEERVIVRSADVASETSRAALFRSIDGTIDRIDWLINCAGIVSGDEESRGTFETLDQDELARTFLVNAIAPLMMAHDAYPWIKQADRPLIANVSSSNGSIAERVDPGKHSYCASKAALNMFTRILAADLRVDGVVVVSLHPGWVKTQMTRDEPAPMDVAESVDGMLEVLDELSMSRSGRFLDWRGNEVPW
jgi:NAD(P)-dependent dehydrogenase (short-subunit alcohol dehydrogenase family)